MLLLKRSGLWGNVETPASYCTDCVYLLWVGEDWGDDLFMATFNLYFLPCSLCCPLTLASASSPPSVPLRCLETVDFEFNCQGKPNVLSAVL